MKRSMLLLFTFSLMFALTAAPAAFAQIHLDDLLEEDSELGDNDTIPSQRIGIPSTEIQLTSNGTGSVGGYCFDEYLIAPRRTTVFEHVLAGTGASVMTAGGAVPLERAIERGDVDVRARQLQVTFVNRTDRPMRITLPEPVVLWERDGGAVNPDALDVLDMQAGYNDRQQRIWAVTTAERNLRMLGYLQGSEWDYDRQRLEQAITAYQRDNGIEPNGRMNMAMLADMKNSVEEIGTRLRRLGYRDREGHSLRTDVAAIIRDYERRNGFVPAGTWNDQLDARLEVDEKFSKQFAALRSTEQSIGEALGEGNSDIVTYVNSLDGFMALVETPNGIELFNRGGRSVGTAAAGRDAVMALDEAAMKLAGRVSRDDRHVIYPRVSNGESTTMMIGDENVVVPTAALQAWIDGGDVPAELAAVLAPMVPNSGGQLTGRTDSPTIIVYNGPLSQGRAPEALATLGLSQVDGNQLASALDRTYGDRIELYTSDDLRHGASRFQSGEYGFMRMSSPRTMYAAR